MSKCEEGKIKIKIGIEKRKIKCERTYKQTKTREKKVQSKQTRKRAKGKR